MSVEDVVARIVAVRRDVSRADVFARLDKERERVGGLISDVSLLRVIAAEYGVRAVDESDVAVRGLRLADLLSGLNNITVVGRVVGVLGVKSFAGVKSGRFASVLIADESAIVRVVLWNDQAGVVESDGLKVSDVVKFAGCYSREDRRGSVELHVSEKGEITVDPSDADGSDFPGVEAFLTRISDLDVKRVHDGLVNVVGDVEEASSVTTFDRKDGVGKVMRVVLSDGSGTIVAVLWNEWVDKLEKVLVDPVGLRLVQAKVKRSMNGEVELHVDSGTYAEIVEGDGKKVVRIGDLRLGMSGVCVEGFVVGKPTVRVVKTSQGEEIKLAAFELKDDCGSVWVSVWREQVKTVEGLAAGAHLRVENAYVKKSFGDQLELSTRNGTRLNVK